MIPHLFIIGKIFFAAKIGVWSCSYIPNEYDGLQEVIPPKFGVV